jgi:hypothetical protein
MKGSRPRGRVLGREEGVSLPRKGSRSRGRDLAPEEGISLPRKGSRLSTTFASNLGAKGGKEEFGIQT